MVNANEALKDKRTGWFVVSYGKQLIVVGDAYFIVR